MKDFIHNLVETNDRRPAHLLAILRAIQAHYHYIPKEAIRLLSEALKLSQAHIIGVVEFYSFFHLSPRGRYDILISDSITDHMLGKQNLMEYFSNKLDVSPGAVRADGLVSLDDTSCTGMCDQGPAGLINGRAITRLDRPRLDAITQLINIQAPLDKWPDEFFQVEDNIYKSDLLLSSRLAPGEGLQAAYSRGIKESLTEIDKSGLRGRGGAGFKTAMKWRFCSEEPEQERYVVCNADEGEPGTFKDRVLLNSHADQVFEGMTLCAAIIGAKQGFLYLRGEYLHLYEKLENILQQRREAGLLGRDILGKGLDFDIEICLGAGAYICGEESALIE
ncbi:MAG: NAD(P)H-dependent oxidoreductase subunit E, partial [Methylomicrobium sp.]|nr:NAD(P)H-dependent oxidoreductase subunit E [Methylomicrobium sp.]